MQKKIMRYVKIQPIAVSNLRDKLGITQQELAARVGCSLSAVQFWEAGRSSPRGYRLRRLLELCPDEEARSLFTAPPPKPTPRAAPRQTQLPGQAELERSYLDPEFLRSLPAETRSLYQKTVENILELSAMKMQGSQVAAEGLHLLAESIIQMAGPAAAPSPRRRRTKLPSRLSPAAKHRDG
jgi:transcriptional regulator with XRE-family HTH domain